MRVERLRGVEEGHLKEGRVDVKGRKGGSDQKGVKGMEERKL